MKPLFFLAALLLATSANAQQPAAHRNFFARTVGGFGHEIKQTFIDVKHDPLWGIYVIGTITLNALDTSTTCAAMGQGGWHEKNPLLGRHPSCGKLAAIGVPLTVVELTSIHKLRSGFYGKCKTDANNPDSLYNRIAEKRGISRDPERCRYAMDMVGMMEWPMHAAIVKGNIDFLTWRMPKH